MANATPKSKLEEFGDLINEMGRGLLMGASFNEMAWRRLLREVEGLQAIAEHCPVSLLQQAVLWSIRGDIEKTERLFDIYAGKFGKDWRWHATRSAQGATLGKLSMVTDMLEFGYPRDSKSDLTHVAEVCSQSGLFYSSQNALIQLGKIDAEALQHVVDSGFAHLDATVSYMRKNSVDELDVAKRIYVATSVMLKHVERLTEFSIYSNDFGITFEYLVDSDIETLIDIDFEISEALSEQFEDTLSEHISIGTYSMDRAA